MRQTLRDEEPLVIHWERSELTPIRIFISSVQREFTKERAALRDYIHGDPILKHFFDVFLFEDIPASDQRPDTLYLGKVARCDIYVGLFGSQYGSEDKEGLSPTEREFNKACELGKDRFIFVTGVSTKERDVRMAKLINRAEQEVVRKSFKSIEELEHAILDSLTLYLQNLLPFSRVTDNDHCRTSTEAEDVLGRYLEAVYHAYTLPEPLVPFNCRLDGRGISSGDVSRLITEERTSILLRGPSGYGKTRLAADAALEFCRHRGIAITIEAKNYTGSLMTVLDSEAHLMDVPSAAKLLSAARRLQRPILLIVDGYNECDEAMRAPLTLEFASWVRRLEASVLITSQIPLMRDDLLTYRTIEVAPFAKETKIGNCSELMR